MKRHYELSDAQFENQLHDCSLAPTFFSHEAHIRIAWIHISKYGVKKAAENITSDLKRYVNSLGAADKYNETLTIVAVEIVNHFMQKAEAESFEELIEEYPVLVSDFKGLIDSHYSFDIFNNSEAKSVYLKPDLLSFTS